MARRATLLEEIGHEVRELCPMHNPDWRFLYLDGDTAYYSAGNCSKRTCELAGLIEQNLATALGHPIRLERTPEEKPKPPKLTTALIAVTDL